MSFQAYLDTIEDKTGLTRVPVVVFVGGVESFTWLVLFPTTTGLNTLAVVASCGWR